MEILKFIFKLIRNLLAVSVSLGNVLTPTQVKDPPTVDWDAEADAFYTLCMTDPDAVSIFICSYL